jgi:hypothetical protein
MTWVAEDNFDSYPNGDLTGNNGGTGFSGAWGAGAAYDVQGTTTYQGAKAITQTAANQQITRTLTTDVATGTLYIAMRANSTMINNSGDGTFRLLDTGGSVRVLVGYHSNTFKYGSGGSLVTLFTPAADTWYLIEIELVTGGDYKLRYHNGTSWSTQTAALPEYAGSGLAVRTVAFNCGGVSGATSLFDYISPTNPIGATFTPTPMMHMMQIAGGIV